MTQTLRRRASSGVRWTLIDGVGEKALSLLTTMVLARLLAPADFGLYALMFVVIDTLAIFKNLGLDAAIIQRKDRITAAADTAFYVLPLFGFALFGLLYVSAPHLAAWLREPKAAPLLQVLGSTIVIMSLGNVPSALLQKQMQFRRHTLANLIGMACYAALAIALAWRGWGVWSLVVAYTVDLTVTAICQWAFVAWRPSGAFDPQLLRTMLQYSKYVVGAGLIGFLANNADKVIIGRVLGTTALGYYTLACSLAYVVVTQLTRRVYQVAFPAFAEVQEDRPRLRAGFLKMVRFLSATAFPVCLLAGLLAQPLILTIYGRQWHPAAPVLAVLALGGAFQVVRMAVNPVLLACGKSSMGLWMNVLQLAILLGVTPWAAKELGLTGAAWVSTAAFGLSALLGAGATARYLRVPGRDLLRATGPVGQALVASAAAALAGQWGLAHWPGSTTWPALVPLVLIGSLAAAAYLWVLRQADPTLLNELRQLAMPQRAQETA